MARGIVEYRSCIEDWEKLLRQNVGHIQGSSVIPYTVKTHSYQKLNVDLDSSERRGRVVSEGPEQ